MKTILLAISVGAAIMALPVEPQRACAADGAADFAISGCCKEKRGSSWVPIGQDFDDCVRRNASEDQNDNVLDRAGRIWWDVNC